MDSKSTLRGDLTGGNSSHLAITRNRQAHTPEERKVPARALVHAVIACKCMTSLEKGQPSSFECVQPRVRMCREGRIKVGLLYLVGLGWIKATQRRAEPPRPPQTPLFLLSKTCQCWPQLHSVLLLERRLTYSICAALWTSEPTLEWQQSVWCSKPTTTTSVTLSFHLHKDRNDMASPSSHLQLPHFCLKTWWTHKRLSDDTQTAGAHFSSASLCLFTGASVSKSKSADEGKSNTQRVLHSSSLSRHTPSLVSKGHFQKDGGDTPFSHHLTWVCPSARTNRGPFPACAYSTMWYRFPARCSVSGWGELGGWLSPKPSPPSVWRTRGFGWEGSPTTCQKQTEEYKFLNIF